MYKINPSKLAGWLEELDKKNLEHLHRSSVVSFIDVPVKAMI